MRHLPLLSLILFLSSLPVHAQEILIDDHRHPDFREIQGMIRLEHRTDVQIRDQVAEVVLEDLFRNPNRIEIEGIYLTPLPSDAQVRQFKMTINGKEMSAELLDAQKARQIYDEIVRRRRDPALLELVGQQLLKASIYPIAAGGEVRIRMSWTQLLSADRGIVSFVAPFARQTGNPNSIPRVLFQGRIESKGAIRNVYSPTHSLHVVREGDRAAAVSFEASSYLPNRNLQLYYSLSEDDFGMTLLTHKPRGEDGFFALLLSPKVEIAREKILPKDVLFIVDRSGSMTGEKTAQARNALLFCIERLRPEDRFNIVDFATDVSSFETALVNASPDNRERARNYVSRIEAAGSTNIDEALQKGLAMLEKKQGRHAMVLFATDGLPTVGERNLEQILSNVRRSNDAGSLGRMFVFGVGLDVNTLFLDKLAEMTRGARDYVQPQEDIEAKVSALYAKVSQPLLTDLSLDFGSSGGTDFYPRTLPDLFQGGQLVLFGRYRTSGNTTLELRGTAGEERRTFRYDVSFPDEESKNDFLPRLWAGRKIAFLVDGIRLGEKPSKEVTDEILHLGKKYGIVTPYTSFLITEETSTGMRDRLQQEFQRQGSDALRSGTPAEAPASARAQNDSEEARKGKESADAGAYEGAVEKYGGGGRNSVSAIRTIGSKTFYLRDGVWEDGEFDREIHKTFQTVVFLSGDYQKLMSDHPGIVPFLSLGSRLALVWEGQAYVICLDEK